MEYDYARSKARVWTAWMMAMGGVSACAGVALDALTAHAFSQRLAAHELTTLSTAARYLLIHGLLLVVLAKWHAERPDSRLIKAAAALAAIGIVLFCGGLTASVLSGVHGFGAAAPMGGSAFMAAWLACALYGLGRRATA